MITRQGSCPDLQNAYPIDRARKLADALNADTEDDWLYAAVPGMYSGATVEVADADGEYLGVLSHYL